MTVFYNRINKIFNKNNNNNIILKFNKNTNFEEFKKNLILIENSIFIQYGNGGNSFNQNNQINSQRDNNRLFFPYKI